jgi:hypothetical protein
MRIKTFMALAVSAHLWGCAAPQQCETTAGKGQAPVILDSYAPEEIRSGRTWRIYLHAKDDDGDMMDIAAIVRQPGMGTYTTDFTRIKAVDSKEVAGYLFLSTPVDSNLYGEKLNLKMFVRDCQGNKSDPVNFPLKFGFRPAQEELPGKWGKAADNQLGAIMIELRGSPSRSSHGRS